MKLKIIFLVTVLFISCATTSIVNTDKLWENLGAISYGTDSNQFIEITIPKNNSLSYNVILFLHGYQVRMADPSFIEIYRDDYIIGKLDYRHLTPKRAELSMEELLLDLHNGLSSLKETVEERGLITNKVILIGFIRGLVKFNV